MTQEQLRLDVQSTVKSYVLNLMRQNNIPAAMMEDALNFTLLDVKDAVFQEFIAAVSAESQPQDTEAESKEEADGE